MGTALINMYAKNMCLDDAGIIFHRLRKKDLLAWTAIISAYISSDEVYRAVNCFCQMQKEGLKPNEFALSKLFEWLLRFSYSRDQKAVRFLGS